MQTTPRFKKAIKPIATKAHMPYEVARVLDLNESIHESKERKLQKRFNSQKSYGGKGWGGP